MQLDKPVETPPGVPMQGIPDLMPLLDRFGARLFSTTGLVVMAGAFVGLLLVPVNFSYPAFALLPACRPTPRTDWPRCRR
ncbi:hypothetical protein [Nonomuraea cypriaca]|uniref:hypothetical protein n=1 Tax=Nonomuraea cypriaca TaxID=1187855 RepID=UPI001A9CAC78|nr:hypothetical protein [Nonomuraea cypriaca]